MNGRKQIIGDNDVDKNVFPNTSIYPK